MKKIYIETLGCSKNQIDSEKISYILENSNYQITSISEEADIIIVNTCSFIQKAKEEAIEIILQLAELKKTGCEKLIVAGCLAQQYSKNLLDEIKEIDAVFGIGDISRILEAVEGKHKIIIPDYNKEKLIKRKIIGFPGSAYLRISDGCSNYCSYCSIPNIRGNLRSRELENIIEELNFLKSQKIREIIIIAQDTTNYGIDLYKKRMIGELVSLVDDNIENDCWLRVLYMHPDHINDELMKSLKHARHFIPYFDIPFQSGSDRILGLMGRKGTASSYLDLVKNIKADFNDAVLRSTFITGFPSETDVDHKMTIDFIEKAEIEWVGGFTYSKEENTEASKMKKHVKQKVKDIRLENILDISEKITEKRLTRFVGKKEKILIEEKVDNEDELFIGRFWGQSPEIDGLTVVDCEKAELGEFSEVEIKRINGKDLYGIG
jgi:ribosomal protein S12 methylthiotransferase